MNEKDTYIQSHPAYQYAKCASRKSNRNVPKYVKLQCKEFLKVADGKHKKYTINFAKLKLLDGILTLLIMPKGTKKGKPLNTCMAGFQWLFCVAVLCIVHRKNPSLRRYQTAILELSRKNGKTFLVAVIFIILLLIEPEFSQFYSIAPDGDLSGLVKLAMQELLISSPAIASEPCGKLRFKIKRDQTDCLTTKSVFKPLKYSNDRMDGREPNVFLADEVGVLPNNSAIESMRSGQISVANPLGCIISTKYPSFDNPMEEEVTYAKEVLDGSVSDETVFALLYEPDEAQGWETNDHIIKQANPLSLEVPALLEIIKKMREKAILSTSKRRNFLTKHCNIIYLGGAFESYVSIDDLKRGKRSKLDWRGKRVYIGVDLAMTNDNCAVSMVTLDDLTGELWGESVAFLPEGRIEEKNQAERINYHDFIKACNAVACGDRIVDYSVIEEFVFSIEFYYGVKIMGIGFDRHNAMSSAQKWATKYNTVQVVQHSTVLHPAVKYLSEKIADGKFLYSENHLLEINFANCRCDYDTNMNRYIRKKQSKGKIDMVVGLINATYLLIQLEVLTGGDFVIQVA